MAALKKETIEKMFNVTLDESEYARFIQICEKNGLSPFTGEIYITNDGRRNKFIIGKEGYLKIADSTEEYDGMEAGVFYVTMAGEVRKISGACVPNGVVPIGGWAEVTRKDRKKTTYQSVSMQEYHQGNNMWTQRPATMIRKVAICQALREAFPKSFNGIYDEAEMGYETPVIPANEAKETVGVPVQSEPVEKPVPMLNTTPVETPAVKPVEPSQPVITEEIVMPKLTLENVMEYTVKSGTLKGKIIKDILNDVRASKILDVYSNYPKPEILEEDKQAARLALGK